VEKIDYRMLLRLYLCLPLSSDKVEACRWRCGRSAAPD